MFVAGTKAFVRNLVHREKHLCTCLYVGVVAASVAVAFLAVALTLRFFPCVAITWNPISGEVGRSDGPGLPLGMHNTCGILCSHPFSCNPHVG